MKQSVFTVVADVATVRLDGLRQTLAEIAADPGGNGLLPFARFEHLHFASLVLAAGPRLRSPKLILEANVDGTAENWLAAVVATAPAGLDALYAGSPGYPGRGAPAELAAWLEARIVRPRAYHIGATGRSMARIAEERRLHQAIGTYLDHQDRSGELKGASAAAIRARIAEYVAADPDLASARRPSPSSALPSRMRGIIHSDFFPAQRTRCSTASAVRSSARSAWARLKRNFSLSGCCATRAVKWTERDNSDFTGGN